MGRATRRAAVHLALMHLMFGIFSAALASVAIGSVVAALVSFALSLIGMVVFAVVVYGSQQDLRGTQDEQKRVESVWDATRDITAAWWHFDVNAGTCIVFVMLCARGLISMYMRSWSLSLPTLCAFAWWWVTIYASHLVFFGVLMG